MPRMILRSITIGVFVAAAAIGLFAAVVNAPRATAAGPFVVDTVADDGGLTACTAAANDCSLRGAVSAANASVGSDSIMFNIPAVSCPLGVCRITLTEGPLVVTEAVDIDGSSQPQNSAPQANVCATATEPSYMRIEIVTAPTSGGGTAFEIDHAAGSSTVRGLAIGTDILGIIAGVKLTDGSGHQVACNHFGLDAEGSLNLGTGGFFFSIDIEGLASGVIVGTNGDDVNDIAERNVFGVLGSPVYINANDSNWVAGNFFGFAADGTELASSGTLIVRQTSSGNLIGSNEDGISDEIERNYFASSTGIWWQASLGTPTNNRVVGNTFGFAPNGAAVSILHGIRLTGLDADETGFEIRKNTFASASFGVLLSSDEAAASVLVSDNVFGTATDGSGVYGNDFAMFFEGAGSHVVRDNDVFNSTTAGIRLDDTVGFGADSTGNCLGGNTIGVTNTTGSSTPFTGNWWGASDGPASVGFGSGDTVSVDVTFFPWLGTPPTRCVTGPAFDDVPTTHTFFTAVEWMASLGITKGCNPPDNTLFCPDNSVTRGQMAAFLRRALEDTLVPGDTVMFTDTADSVFVADIEWLGSVGITKGCNPPVNDEFCPDDSVTRDQMAAFLVRAFGYTAGAGSDRFTDDDGSIFEADIERLAQAGVTLGCNPPANDAYCPSNTVTRGQMAAFLFRAMVP